MAIQNDNTILCKGDLKAYHEKILPYLGGNFMLGTNVSDYYSTDEKIVGVWTNGKPIYKKTFTVEVPSGTSKTDFTQVNLSTTSNPEVIVDSNITIDYFNNNSSTPHWKDNSPQEDEAFIFINSNLIGLNYRVQSQLPINIYATAYYTKTTDAANSAVTTPGCYDLNRPDLWPSKKEIFFGNGLYGKRYIGTQSVGTTNMDFLIDSSFPVTVASTKIKNIGGSVRRASNNSIVPFPNANTIAPISYWAGTLNNQTGLFIEGHDNGNNTWDYDVWVTYTK